MNRRRTLSFLPVLLLTAIAFSRSGPKVIVDLMRLQSDTAFLGALTKVPSGTYTVQVSLSSPEITFLNDTGSTIKANGQTCLSGIVCTATLMAVGTPQSALFNANTGGQQGIELESGSNLVPTKGR